MGKPTSRGEDRLIFGRFGHPSLWKPPDGLIPDALADRPFPRPRGRCVGCSVDLKYRGSDSDRIHGGKIKRSPVDLLEICFGLRIEAGVKAGCKKIFKGLKNGMPITSPLLGSTSLERGKHEARRPGGRTGPPWRSGPPRPVAAVPRRGPRLLSQPRSYPASRR